LRKLRLHELKKCSALATRCPRDWS
jgi:hypothetical protein